MAIKNERLYTFKEIRAMKDLPIVRSRRSWWLYCTKGVVAGNGYRMILESVKIGNRHHTSREAVLRFIDALARAGR
jgi:hypothetical protein